GGAVPLAIAVMAVVAGIVAVLGGQPSAASSPQPLPDAPTLFEAADGSGSDHRRELGADGDVVDGVTVFDDVPAVANLDPDLLDALRQAATDAAADGGAFPGNSGGRSPAHH